LENADVGLIFEHHNLSYGLLVLKLNVYSLLPDVAYCYLIAYYLVPKFLLRKKYLLFFLIVLTSTLIHLLILIGIGYWLFGISKYPGAEQIGFFVKVSQRTITGAPAACFIFLAIKMFKTWYQKQDEKQMLLKANADAEIKLLKAQVQPHFLFNTLNNIYSFTLDKSSKAEQLVVQLSDMLKYMINDCDAEYITLEKEITILKNYIALEKVRYGNRLEIEAFFGNNYQGKSIAPLLMFPFVENSFKHGTSKMLHRPWIKVIIEINEDELFFSLSNSKPALEDNKIGKGGIGLKNVKKRLQLLYPQSHSLTISSSADVFTVELKLPVHQIKLDNKITAHLKTL
jgi:sensor histidine kinase YesM